MGVFKPHVVKQKSRMSRKSKKMISMSEKGTHDMFSAKCHSKIPLFFLYAGIFYFSDFHLRGRCHLNLNNILYLINMIHFIVHYMAFYI